MAKTNASDILTADWNPIIGCERYSDGCKNCWYLDGIFPWQKRLGRIPEEVEKNEHHVFATRLDVESLRAKNGIVGVVQHGDLFWDQVPEMIIHKVLDIVDTAANKKRVVPKYILWTKRAERMANILTQRYPEGLPTYLAASVSIENQQTANERLPQLKRIKGIRIIMIEPMLGPITLKNHLPVEWVVVGSETGSGARHISLDWVRKIRDEVKTKDIPFFIKQLGNHHKKSVRILDGREWNEFPQGFKK